MPAESPFVRLCRLALGTVLVGTTLSLFAPAAWVRWSYATLSPGDRVLVTASGRGDGQCWTVEKAAGDRVLCRGGCDGRVEWFPAAVVVEQ